MKQVLLMVLVGCTMQAMDNNNSSANNFTSEFMQLQELATAPFCIPELKELSVDAPQRQRQRETVLYLAKITPYLNEREHSPALKRINHIVFNNLLQQTIFNAACESTPEGLLQIYQELQQEVGPSSSSTDKETFTQGLSKIEEHLKLFNISVPKKEPQENK